MAQDKVSIRWLLHYLAWQQFLALKAAAACSFVEMNAKKSFQSELSVSGNPFMQLDQKDRMYTMSTIGKMNQQSAHL